ncbi:MAG TPA: hypothetical protein VNA30_03220 [Mycobacteriales bacterium]|nr:hypothetical protein [Mycobacteriales bacterium]
MAPVSSVAAGDIEADAATQAQEKRGAQDELHEAAEVGAGALRLLLGTGGAGANGGFGPEAAEVDGGQ